MSPWHGFGPGAAAWDGVPGLAMPCPRTALRVEGNQPRQLEAHLARLEAGAYLLLQAVPTWLPAAGQELATWLSTQAEGPDRALRLHLLLASQVLVASLEPLPGVASPYRLVLMAHPLAPRQADPHTQHKGLCGPWSAAVLAAAVRQGAADALLTWPDGTLAETAIAAVGLEREGEFWLPPHAGRVQSLAEKLDLPAWSAQRGWRLRREPLPVCCLAEGQLWCMNALRGLWPATLAYDPGMRRLSSMRL